MPKTKDNTLTSAPPTKVYYTTKDIAGFLGLSVYGARKFMMRLNIRFYYIGGKIIFFLSDINDSCPALMNSIREAKNLNALEGVDSLLGDEDPITKYQLR